MPARNAVIAYGNSPAKGLTNHRPALARNDHYSGACHAALSGIMATCSKTGLDASLITYGCR